MRGGSRVRRELRAGPGTGSPTTVPGRASGRGRRRRRAAAVRRRRRAPGLLPLRPALDGDPVAQVRANARTGRRDGGQRPAVGRVGSRGRAPAGRRRPVELRLAAGRGSRVDAGDRSVAPRAAISRGGTYRSPVPRFHCSLASSGPGGTGRDARAAYHRSAGRAGRPVPGRHARRWAPRRFVRQSGPMDPRRGDRPSQVRPRPPSTGRPAPVRTRSVTPSPTRLTGYRRIERRRGLPLVMKAFLALSVVMLGAAILWAGSGQVGPFISSVVKGFGGFVSQVGVVAGSPKPTDAPAWPTPRRSRCPSSRTPTRTRSTSP